MNIVQSATAGATGGGSTAQTAAKDFSNSTLVFVGVAYFGTSVPAITDTASTKFFRLNSTVAGTADGLKTDIFVGFPINPGSAYQVTATLASGACRIAIVGISGRVGQLYDFVSNVAGSANSNSPGSTTALDNNLLIVFVGLASGSTSAFTVNSGFTVLESVTFSSGNSYGIILAYKFAIAGVITPTASWTTNAASSVAHLYRIGESSGGGSGGGLGLGSFALGLLGLGAGSVN